MSDAYRLIEHTADIGIEARTETLSGLFVAVGLGLREILCDPVEKTADRTVSVELEAADAGELLVNWLNELLYLFETRGLFPVDVLVDAVDGEYLRARVRGFRFEAGRESLDHEVKAATYHQLKVEQDEEGAWFARVYLDL